MQNKYKRNNYYKFMFIDYMFLFSYQEKKINSYIFPTQLRSFLFWFRFHLLLKFKVYTQINVQLHHVQ